VRVLAADNGQIGHRVRNLVFGAGEVVPIRYDEALTMGPRAAFSRPKIPTELEPLESSDCPMSQTDGHLFPAEIGASAESDLRS